MIITSHNQITPEQNFYMALEVENLIVGNYMTAYPISVLPEVSIREAADFLGRRGIGNLIVSMDDGTPLGIFTERDVLKQIFTKKTLPDLPINESEYQPFEKISPDTTVIDAAKTMISKKARLLVFADSNKLVGIVTASDLVRAFRKTYVAPPLDEVISKKIYKCPFDDSILTAVELMHSKGVGSVIVESSDSRYGIFTERDLIFKVLINRVELGEKIELYSSFPLITAKDGILANEAASIMSTNNIKRLALADKENITGIVTARDLVEAYQSEIPKIKNY